MGINSEEKNLKRARKIKIYDRMIPFATPEDMIVFKLLADRPQDRTDIEALLHYHPSLDWNYIEKWCAVWEISERLFELRKS